MRRRHALGAALSLATCVIVLSCVPPPVPATGMPDAARGIQVAVREAGAVLAVDARAEDAAVSPFCAALQAHNDGVLAEEKRAHRECDRWPSLPDVSCVGNVGLRIEDVRIGPNRDTSCDDAKCRVGVRARLSHAAPDGGPPATLRVGLADDGANIQLGGRNLSLSNLIVADLDHDGEPEVFVSSVASCNAPGGSWHELYTFSHGKFGSYRPAADFHQLESLEDVDGDGLLDLTSAGPYDVTTYPLGPEYPLRHAFLAKGNKDGTFSLDTPLSREHLRQLCPVRVDLHTVLRRPVALSNVVLPLMCERVNGLSAADVMRILKQELCTGFDDRVEGAENYPKRGLCPGALRQLVETDPPLQLFSRANAATAAPL